MNNYTIIDMLITFIPSLLHPFPSSSINFCQISRIICWKRGHWTMRWQDLEYWPGMCWYPKISSLQSLSTMNLLCCTGFLMLFFLSRNKRNRWKMLPKSQHRWRVKLLKRVWPKEKVSHRDPIWALGRSAISLPKVK